ncbi:MAG: HlyD family efflux transporter periplasmic adaptor subunit [Gammaproteobacteria bacterium]|nr:HlyD family efflux transporter periplasmic adaptor subunit [Gammaproteobacteria bacterium]
MRQKFLIRRNAPLLLLASALLVTIGLYLLRPQPVPVASSEKRWHVAVRVVEPTTASPTLPLYGFIESPATTRISSAVIADVVAVHALEGTAVAADELVIELDRTELELVVAQRQANLDETIASINQEKELHLRDKTALLQETKLLNLAQRGASRAIQLAEQKLGPAAGVDEAERVLAQQQLAVNNRQLSINNHPARLSRLQAEANRNRALLAQARLDLERTHIRATFAGRIATVDVAIGDRVQVGSPLLTLYDTARLELRTQVPNQYIGQLKTALQNGMALSAWSTIDGQKKRFVLDRLAGEVARESGGASAFFRLVETRDDLPLGQFLDITLILPEVENVVAIPFAALYGNNLIYRVVEERMEALQVRRIGTLRDDQGSDRALVDSPELSPTDLIVVTQLPNAVDGLLVQTITKP